LSTILALVGILLCAYAVAGRLIGPATLGFLKIVPTMKATAVMTAGNTALLLAILLKLPCQK